MSATHSNGNGVPAVSYIRMSSDQQDASPGQQRDEIAKLAARDGYHLVGEYFDAGVSGDATDKRHGFQRMIRDAAGGKFSVIISWDQDRFSRADSIESGFYIHPLRQAGVRLVTVAQGVVDWTSFSGRLIYNVQQEGKHAFLRDLSRNVLRGRIAAAKRGEWLSPPPLGYRVEAKRLVPGDPQAVSLVRRVFHEYLGGHSLRAIAVVLNAEGIQTPRGKLWDGRRVRDVLTNAAYAGRYVWGDQQTGKYHTCRSGEVSTDVRGGRCGDAVTIMDNHPAIIDRVTFDAVQRRLVARRTATTPHAGGGDFVFTRLVKCGKCAGRMYGYGSGHSVRYRCQDAKTRKTCDVNTVSQAELLDAVLGAIESRFADPSTVERLRTILVTKAKQRTKTVNVDDLRKGLAKVDTQLTTARRNMALADGDDMRREYETVVRELRQERDRLDASLVDAQRPRGRDQDELDQRINKAVDMLSRLRSALLTANAVKQRELLGMCIEKVEVWSTRTSDRGWFDLDRGVVHLRPNMWLAEADNLCGSANRKPSPFSGEGVTSAV
jgi:site-specific DNA recombinase